MIHAEVAKLLTDITAFDRRTLGDADVIAWHSAIGDLPYQLAHLAVVKHYSTSRDWIMPADVRKLVTAEQHDRAMRTPLPGNDDLIPMPDYFRATVEEHKRRARAHRDQQREAGDPVTFGAAISTSFDHRRNR